MHFLGLMAVKVRILNELIKRMANGLIGLTRIRKFSWNTVFMKMLMGANSKMYLSSTSSFSLMKRNQKLYP